MKAWVTTQEGVRSCPRGEQRAAGLGGAGHDADLQMSAARAGLVSQGLWQQGRNLLWDHTYQQWESLTGSSCLSVSPVLVLNWPSNVCNVPRELLFQTGVPCIWPIPATVAVFLVSKWCTLFSLGTRHKAVVRYLFPR